MYEYRAINDYGEMEPIEYDSSKSLEAILQDTWTKYHCRFLATIKEGVIVCLDEIHEDTLGFVCHEVSAIRHLNGSWRVGDDLSRHNELWLG